MGHWARHKAVIDFLSFRYIKFKMSEQFCFSSAFFLFVTFLACLLSLKEMGIVEH